jgi:hypothetical protein
MKKLLLILLCLPVIGFGQTKVFNLDKKYANMQMVNKNELDNIHSLTTSFYGKNSHINTLKVKYQNKNFTGCSVELKDKPCPNSWFNQLGGSKTNHFEMEMKVDTAGNYLFGNEVIEAIRLREDVFRLHSSCNENKYYETTYYIEGEPLHTALIWDCGYKLVLDWQGNISSGYRSSTYTFYYPNNNILEYNNYIGQPRILKYYENGNLFEEQLYKFLNQDKDWITNPCLKKKWLPSRQFFDTRGRPLHQVIQEMGKYMINKQTHYNLITEETSIGMENFLAGAPYSTIDTYSLEEFIDVFLNDCKKNGINIKNQRIKITFEELEGNSIAMAYGLNLNDDIIIKVDPANWQNASIEKKWYIIYHELGHDVLNLEHGQGGKMMFNFADKEYDWLEFFQDKKGMFDYYRNKNPLNCVSSNRVLYDILYDRMMYTNTYNEFKIKHSTEESQKKIYNFWKKNSNMFIGRTFDEFKAKYFTNY